MPADASDDGGSASDPLEPKGFADLHAFGVITVNMTKLSLVLGVC